MKKYLSLKASAGSGKTFALTVRYISLLLKGIDPSEILTLTFTNKAVVSMTQRIYNTLFELGDDLNILEEILKQTNLDKDTILDKKEMIIKKFIASSLSIFTIDKFVNKILREFSGYVDIDDDFQIAYDDEELLLYKFLLSLDNEQFTRLIQYSYNEQKKLKSIVELFKQLSDKNETLPRYSIDFDIYQILKDDILKDAFIIKDFVDNSDLSNVAKNAVDFQDILGLLSKGATWLAKDSLQGYKYFKKSKTIENLDSNFVRLKTNLVKYYYYQDAISQEGLFSIFEDFKSFRHSYNKQRNSLEFSDITNITYQLLSTFIDRDFLYFRLDSSYSSILIDEFQDTSVLQYKILEPLISEIVSSVNNDKLKTFFYVGDTKQSIYRFRGGKKELFDHLLQKFHPQIKLEILDTNYRSSQNIVQFVNQAFLDIPNYEYYPQKIKHNTQGYIQIIKFDPDENELYQQISDKIFDLVQKGLDINNIAILTYTNQDVLDLYNYLKNRFPNFKINTEMTSKLINEPNVKALINYIKYLYFQEQFYLCNFNAIVGNDINTQASISVDIYKNPIAFVLKYIATNLNIVDKNIIELIQLSSQYHNIVDFVYNIDRLDAISVGKDNSGLQILTIFKSKGLEFDTVFVLDRIKRKNSDRSTLLFEYDKIDLVNIYTKKSKRELLDQDYQKALDKEHTLQRDDELNVLYVALTRAKENMIIFKKEKQSVFDMLNYQFDNIAIGKLEIQKNLSTKNNIQTQLQYEKLDLGVQQNVSNPKESDTELKAQYFGLATHYCLELLNSFTKDELDIAITVIKNRYSYILDSIDFDDIYNRVSLLIDNIKFQELIKDGNLYKEQTVVYNNDNSVSV